MSTIIILIVSYVVLMKFLRSYTGRLVRFGIEEEISETFSIKGKDLNKIKEQKEATKKFLDEFYE